jgi:hypothetical protein
MIDRQAPALPPPKFSDPKITSKPKAPPAPAPKKATNRKPVIR